MLSDLKTVTLEQKATVDWSRFDENVMRYLEDKAPDAWRAAFAPLIKGVVTDQVKEWSVRLGLRFDVQNLFARDWFNRYMLTFATDIMDTTKRDISKVLNQAMREGWSIPRMQSNLTDLFRQWMKGDMTAEQFQWFEERLPRYRTEMIARTETIRASNAGTTEQYKAWGVQRRKWLATRDNRVRDAHAAADGTEAAIDQPFDVGGEPLMYPGDPSGSPENTINCRCTTIPIVEGME